MSEDQMSLPVFAVILLVSGLIIRYLFFTGPTPQPPSSSRSLEAQMRSRELAVERIQQMFPQVERRAILWDLQRNGGSIQSTTERILSGRLDTPPITFQPPPPLNQTPTVTPSAKHPEMPKQPDLITRYNLKDRVDAAASAVVVDKEEVKSKDKGWSSNRDERQAALQRRRDEMILAARRKMEAKLASERVAGEN